ncbi:MAG: hypothetical protein BAJATHORv1_180003 [Candidatus Thorarchaeota archaeon]|nr:MAG: hypothetical protein BAJATHORv1_180003 [Candidatus Thorarchaeota archaeon]
MPKGASRTNFVVSTSPREETPSSSYERLLGCDLILVLDPFLGFREDLLDNLLRLRIDLGGLVRRQDVAHASDGAVLHRLLAGHGPALEILSIEQVGVPELGAEVAAGVGLLQVVAVGAHVVDHAHGQSVVVDLDTAGDAPGVADGLIHRAELEERSRHGALGVTDVVAEIATGESGEEDRGRALDHRLPVEGLRVGAAARLPQGETGVVRQLGQAGHEEGQLRRAVGQDHGVHVHHGEDATHDEGEPGLDRLGQGQAHPRLGRALDDDARAGDRRRATRDGAGGEDQRHAMLGSEDQLVDGLSGADQGRERLAVVDVVRTALEGLLTAGLGDGDLVDAGRVELIVGPGHNGLAGVGEHAGELVEGAQVVVDVAHGAQRLAEVDVGQRVDRLGDQRDVALGILAAFHALHIDEVGARGARAEVAAPRADVDVVLGIPIPGEDREATGRLLQRVPDHMGGETHPVPLHPRSRVLKNLPGLFVLDLEAGILQQMQYAPEHLLQLILGEHVEAYT